MPAVSVPRPSAATVAWGVRVAVILGLLWLVGRQWHPYFGFTRFLQIDRAVAAEALPVIRDQPVYVHEDEGPYDGAYYGQLATNPALTDPALRTAIDDLGYRARRILLGAAAWALAGGDPIRAMHVYAWANVVLWLGLAVVAWRLFPADLPGTLAWVLVLTGAGVLFCVRLALTDLAALLLVVGAVLAAERGRATTAAALLGVGALARETAVLGAAALAPGRPSAWRELLRPAWFFRALLVVLPLALWLAYVRTTVGASGAGLRNFSLPFLGWAQRWVELAAAGPVTGNPRLQVESWLEHVALTVQVVYLVTRRRWDCPWWRVGAAYVVLAAIMGEAVWDGFPNAASRVLLPLTLAFNLRVVRDRARIAWLIFGNLSVFAGLHAFEAAPGAPHELPAHSTWSQSCLLETDSRWSVAEWNSKRRWAWCGESGGLSFRALPWPERARLELELRGRTPRNVEVRHAGQVVWRGPVSDRPQWITLPPLPFERGRLQLELRSDAPAVAEGADRTARRIGLACFGARLAP